MRDRASEMAAALTYRTIFGLIPMLVMALVIFNAFEGFEKIGEDAIEKILSQMNLDMGDEMIEGEPTSLLIDEQTGQPIDATTPDENSNHATGSDTTKAAADASEHDVGNDGVSVSGSVERPNPDDPSEQQFRLEMRANIKATIDGLIDKIKTLDFTGIGLVGLALLVWAAISLIVTVETAFNRIYNSSSGRGWHQRILLYWSVLTLGPLLLMISIYAATQLMQGGAEIAVVGPLVGGLSRFASFAASWLLLLLLYVLMPNARVHLRPAAIGSFVAALLWELAKGGFRLYVANAVGLEAIYGTLALLPLFLLWMYLTWFIILFGLELTYTLQTLHGRRLEEQARENDDRRLIDLKLAVPMAAAIAQHFRSGDICETSDLASSLNLPGYAADRLLSALQAEGIVHPVERGKTSGFALARPADAITVADVLEAVHREAIDEQRTHQGPGWRCLESIRSMTNEQVGRISLAELLADEDEPEESEQTPGDAESAETSENT